MSKCHALFSLIGSLFSMSSLGNTLPFSTYNIHLSNSIEHPFASSINFPNDNSTYPSMSLFFFPIILLSTNLTSLFSLGLASIINPRTIIGFGYILMTGAYSLLYQKTDLHYQFIAITLLGMGIGIQFNPIMRNLWGFFLRSKGFITIYSLLIYGASSVCFVLFAEYTFTTKEYKEESLKEFFFYITSFTLCSGLLGMVLTYSNHYEFFSSPGKDWSSTVNISDTLHFNDHEHCSINDEEEYNNMHTINQSQSQTQSLIKELTDSKSSSVQTYAFCYKLPMILCSIRFWGICLMAMLSMAFCFNFTHSLRYISLLKGFNESAIFTIIIVYHSSIVVYRIVIGIAYNCIGCKCLFSMVLLMQITICFLMEYIDCEMPNCYYIMVSLGGFCYAANTILMTGFIVKIYGQDHSFEYSGIVNVLASSMSFLAPSLSLVMVKYYSYAGEGILFIRYMFLLSGIASFLALLLCLIIPMTSFSYLTPKEIEMKMWKESTINNQMIDVKSEFLKSNIGL